MARETEIERLVVRLIGDGSSYLKMLKQAQAATKKTEVNIQKLGKSIKSAGESMTRMGRSLTLKVTAPIVAMGVASVKAFADFDKAMIQSTAIMKVTAEQTDRMRKLALDLSGKAIQGPKELASSYFFLASAGLDAEEAMKALPIVTKFATAGAFDMALATDLLTDAQSALGLNIGDTANKMKNMIRVSDVLVKANTLANATVAQFSIALTSKAGAALKSFNKDVEEGVAVLAALADQGIKAELAGNALDRIIRLLSKSSRDSAKEHERFGFRVFDAAGKMRNLGAIIANLETILVDMSDETKSATLEMLGFEARVQGVILPLLGTSKGIMQYEKELRMAGGTTEKVADEQMKSLSARLAKLKNQFLGVAISIGESLVPQVEKLSARLQTLIGWWNGLDEATQGWIITAAAAAAVVGPILLVIGPMIKSVGLLVTGFGLLAGSTVGMAAAFTLAKVALVAFATFLLVDFLIAATGAREAQDDLTRALEESAEAEKRLQKITSVRTTKDIAKAAEKGPGEQRKTIADALGRAKRSATGARSSLISDRARLRRAKGTFSAKALGLLGRKDPRVQEAQRALKESEAGVKEAEKRVKDLQAELAKLGPATPTAAQATPSRIGLLMPGPTGAFPPPTQAPIPRIPRGPVVRAPVPGSPTVDLTRIPETGARRRRPGFESTRRGAALGRRAESRRDLASLLASIDAGIAELVRSNAELVDKEPIEVTDSGLSE